MARGFPPNGGNRSGGAAKPGPRQRPALRGFLGVDQMSLVLMYEYELEKEIEIERLAVDEGFVVDRETGEVVGRVYTY